ncbi:MAG: IclR family transcriptional regulator, partial [Hyphomicrobiaceae bacterium]
HVEEAGATMVAKRTTSRSEAEAALTLKRARRSARKPVAVKRERGGIQSIERAILIVDLVSRNPNGISLAELSSQMGLNNSTVFHLVKTLDKLGIVAQISETKRYRIGSHLFKLAAGALNETTLLSLATPLLERLSRDTGESANLAVRSQSEVVVIARTAATGMLQLSSRAGTTRPVHVTATGKALLATMQSDELEQLLAKHEFKAFTGKSISNAETLCNELKDVRKTGIAYDRCEFDPDVTCVATTAQDFAGRHVAAIGISGPVWRMTPKLLRIKTKALYAIAAELSEKLGRHS